jgi:hypothetical protein
VEELSCPQQQQQQQQLQKKPWQHFLCEVKPSCSSQLALHILVVHAVNSNFLGFAACTTLINMASLLISLTHMRGRRSTYDQELITTFMGDQT